ncbi:hypothetical protein ACJZ2D_006736 [Fusarium nematophilum]
MAYSSLPNEILAHIFSNLDSPSTLEERDFYNEPLKLVKKALLSRELPSLRNDFYPNNPIKSASVVCKSWRRVILPTLFRHVLWCTRCIEKPAEQGDGDSGLPFLDFLLRNGLATAVKSVTILLHYKLTKPLSWEEEEETKPGVTPPPGVKGEIFYPGLQYGHEYRSLPRDNWDNNWIWETIFQHLEPLRFTLVSGPPLLLSLVSRSLPLIPGGLLMAAYSIISVSRARKSPHPVSELPGTDTASLSTTSNPCVLFTIRPWKFLLINEGSCFDLYRTHDEFAFAPFHSGLDHMSYIAVHPCDRKFLNLQMLLPPVKSLYIQVAPQDGPEADEEHLRPSRITEERLAEASVTGGFCLPEMLQQRRDQASLLVSVNAIRGASEEDVCENWEGLKKLVCRWADNQRVWDKLEPFYRMALHNNECKMRYMGHGVFERL